MSSAPNSGGRGGGKKTHNNNHRHGPNKGAQGRGSGRPRKNTDNTNAPPPSPFQQQQQRRNTGNPGLQAHTPDGRFKQNGEKGASASTIDENYKIKFTNILLEFREDESRSELVLGSELTNTERKFVHASARGLGLTSKSKGKEPHRQIHVRKTSNAKKRAGNRNDNDGDSDEDFNPDQNLPKLRLSNRVLNAFKQFSANSPLTEDELLESYQTGSSTLGKANQDVSTLLKNLNLHRETKKRKKPRPFQVNYNERARIYDQFQLKPKPPAMIKQRKTLPAWNFKDEVVNVISSNQVTIVSGDTGCGKSTQVPQFLLDDPNVGRSCKIAITQPRRISAISVAERVSSERGETVANGLVGHVVRLDSTTTKSTQLIFMTPAILLKKLGTDPTLSEYTHVILDEVPRPQKGLSVSTLVPV